MTMLSFFLRFTIAYTLLLATAGIVLGLLGVERLSGINTAVLMGVGFWCFWSYYTKNNRVPESKESWQLIWIALAGDVTASVLLSIPTAVLNGVPIKFLLIGIALITALHLLGLIFISHMTKKQYQKQIASQKPPASSQAND